MMTDEQAERVRANLPRMEGAPETLWIARLLLRYHDALALDRLAHAISEALDEQAERGGGLNVHDLATAVRAKLMEAEHG